VVSNTQGKRKKAAKRPSKKKLDPLPTQFSCLFCNHDDSVVCKLDKTRRIGTLTCKVCGQSHNVLFTVRPFTHKVNEVDLSAPIDVYSDWIDAAEAVQRGGGAVGAGGEDEYEEEFEA
jgi:transcription elongation factor Elf1